MTARPATRIVRRAGVVLSLVATLAASCSTGGDGAATDEGLSVVTAIYPVQEAVERVGGDRVSVTNLTPPGVEPHDLELAPQAVADIQSADVVFYLGGGFQPAVADAANEAEGSVVDLLAGLHPVVPDASAAEADLTVDPHVWLDPNRYRALVAEVEQALTEADPAGAATFAANAASYDGELGALAGAFEAGLAHCEGRTLVTNHAAFGYLAAAYGLSQESISGLAPDAEPSAQRLAELRELVQADHVTTVFTEDLVSPAVAETLANEAGVSTEVLHTLEGLSQDQRAAGADYGSQMRENLRRLRAALGCS